MSWLSLSLLVHKRQQALGNWHVCLKLHTSIWESKGHSTNLNKENPINIFRILCIRLEKRVLGSVCMYTENGLKFPSTSKLWFKTKYKTCIVLRGYNNQKDFSYNSSTPTKTNVAVVCFRPTVIRCCQPHKSAPLQFSLKNMFIYMLLLPPKTFTTESPSILLLSQTRLVKDKKFSRLTNNAFKLKRFVTQVLP